MQLFLIAILAFIVKPNLYTGGPNYNQDQTAYIQNLLQQIQTLSANVSTSTPSSSSSSKNSFSNQWNSYYGYNLTTVDATAGNVACRGRCQKLASSPVCGSNRIRYFNPCDAQCDGIAYGTSDLQFSGKCCCPNEEMSLKKRERVCLVNKVVKNNDLLDKEDVFMVMSQCMANCLTQSGQKLEQKTTQTLRMC